MFILNGRCGSDKNVGNFTFRQTSVIDDAISSYEGLRYISNFRIVELDILFSDGHSLLHVDLNFNSKHYPTKPDLLQNNIPRWVENKTQTFISKFKSDKIYHILSLNYKS